MQNEFDDFWGEIFKLIGGAAVIFGVITLAVFLIPIAIGILGVIVGIAAPVFIPLIAIGFLINFFKNLSGDNSEYKPDSSSGINSSSGISSSDRFSRTDASTTTESVQLSKPIGNEVLNLFRTVRRFLYWCILLPIFLYTLINYLIYNGNENQSIESPDSLEYPTGIIQVGPSSPSIPSPNK